MKPLYERRWFVKIRAGKQEGLATSIYYKGNMTFEFYYRWVWYFRYRAALYQVQNPKHFVVLESGSYDYIETADEKKLRLSNKIKAKKGKVTEYENKLQKARTWWDSNSLFPIEEDEMYKKAVLKIDKVRFELSALQREYNEIQNIP